MFGKLDVSSGDNIVTVDDLNKLQYEVTAVGLPYSKNPSNTLKFTDVVTTVNQRALRASSFM